MEAVKPNEYHEAANAFCQRTGLKVTFQYVGHTERLWADTAHPPTAQFRVTFERDGRKPWSFDYNDSIADSYEWADANLGAMTHRGVTVGPKWGPKPERLYNRVETGTKRKPEDAEREAAYSASPVSWAGWIVRRRIPTPCAYDVLACIEKHEPESFKDWAPEFGYGTDSISARETYLAVVDEWRNVRRMFTDDELSELAGIN